MRNRSHNAGFTILEVLATVTVGAILLTVAVPSYQGFIKKNRMSVTTNTLVSDLNMARSEAIKLGKTVILCNSADPTAASPSCNGTSQDWSTGWIVFVSEDADNIYTAGTDRLIRVASGGSHGITIKANSEAAAYITYYSTGNISPPTAGAFVQMDLCQDSDTASGKEIKIKSTGRPRLISPATTCAPA